MAVRATTKSNQPHRRGRPVVAPNSPPSVLKTSPKVPVFSAGNGPSPTRVVYALRIPMVSIRLFAKGIPVPDDTPAREELEEVTNGYVPKSISNIVPWAPSIRIFLLLLMASINNLLVSVTKGL